MGTSDGGAETETIDYNLRKRYNPVKNSINRNQETGKIRKTACNKFYKNIRYLAMNIMQSVLQYSKVIRNFIKNKKG